MSYWFTTIVATRYDIFNASVVTAKLQTSPTHGLIIYAHIFVGLVILIIRLSKSIVNTINELMIRTLVNAPTEWSTCWTDCPVSMNCLRFRLKSLGWGWGQDGTVDGE